MEQLVVAGACAMFSVTISGLLQYRPLRKDANLWFLTRTPVP
jgi:hypothetical protein